MSKQKTIIIWVVVGIILVGLLFYDRSKLNRRINNPQIVEGLIIGKSKAAKGERYVDYEFRIGNVSYKGSMSVKFCKECIANCCQIGTKVKVRYEKGNPANNDLVH